MIPKCPPKLDHKGKPIPGTHNNWVIIFPTSAEQRELARLREKERLSELCSACRTNPKYETRTGKILAYCNLCLNNAERRSQFKNANREWDFRRKEKLSA